MRAVCKVVKHVRGGMGLESGSLFQTLSLHMVTASHCHLGNLAISLG